MKNKTPFANMLFNNIFQNDGKYFPKDLVGNSKFC
jgi:hypothetical protein